MAATSPSEIRKEQLRRSQDDSPRTAVSISPEEGLGVGTLRERHTSRLTTQEPGVSVGADPQVGTYPRLLWGARCAVLGEKAVAAKPAT